MKRKYKMLFQRIHEYSILFLIDLLVCRCYVSHMDKLHFSSFSNVTSFRTFSLVSLSRCIYECKIRLRCDAINYRSTWKLCTLIRDHLSPTGESWKGYVGGRKADWVMVTIVSTYIMEIFLYTGNMAVSLVQQRLTVFINLNVCVYNDYL